MSARVVEVLLCLVAASALLSSAVRRVGPGELPLLPAPAGRAFDAPESPEAPGAPGTPGVSTDAVAATELEGSGTQDDPWRVDFAAFSFPDYDPPELRGAAAARLPLERFPAAVARCAGSFVRLEGYMLAVDFVDGRVESFVLSRFPPGCCFGATPVFDEWLEARPGPEGVEQQSAYAPLEVRGVLEVGEALDDDGFVTSLYRLRDAEVRELR